MEDGNDGEGGDARTWPDEGPLSFDVEFKVPRGLGYPVAVAGLFGADVAAAVLNLPLRAIGLTDQTPAAAEAAQSRIPSRPPVAHQPAPCRQP
jgi:hypothetical protein